MLFEFSWTRTSHANGFDLASYGVITTPDGAISGIEYFIGDLMYEWVAGDPNLGIWSVYDRSFFHPIALPSEAPFDFANPATPWSLPITEIATPENLIGVEDINNLETHHYYSSITDTDLWLAVDGGFVMKYLVSSTSQSNGKSPHYVRSFELYDINQPIVLQPPAHAQWLVDAMAHGTIHFPSCDTCIFPLPAKIKGIGRSPNTSGRNLFIASEWSIPQLIRFFEEELPNLGWTLSKDETSATTPQLKATDGKNHFVIRVSSSEPSEHRPSINYLSIMPEDITYFPIVLDEK